MTVDTDAVNAAQKVLPDEAMLRAAETPAAPAATTPAAPAEGTPPPATDPAAPPPGEGDEEFEEGGENPPEGGDPDAGAQARRQRPGKWARRVSRLEEANAGLRAQLDTVLSIVRGNGRPTDPAQTPATAPAATPAAEEPPKQDQFESYEAFLKAQARFEARQEVRTEQARAAEAQRAREAEAARARHASAVAERQANFSQQAQAAAERIDDFEEVVFNPKLPITQPMFDVIAGSEKGAEIAYWLGKHPDDAARISRLPLPDAARELGRIEARIAQPQPRRTATAAPAPVSPVGQSGAPSRDPGRMSYEDYKKARMDGDLR
jgi:hypothetical protein